MFKKPRFAWAITALLSVAALAYVFWMFLPRMRSVAAIRHQVSAKHEQISQAAKLAPAVALLTSELVATKSYIQDQKRNLTHPSDLPRLFGQISQLVVNSGASVTRFEPQTPVVMDQLRKVPITVSITGSFEAVSRAIAAVENLTATVWIEDLRVDELRQSGGNVQAELLLAIFTNNRDISD
jgi:type IV pilus assembly protein PilO